MKFLLNSENMQEYIKQLIALEKPAQLIAVDDKIVGRWPATRAGLVNLLNSGGGSTELSRPLQKLREAATRVIVITDNDGQTTLVNMGVGFHPSMPPTPGIIVACIDTIESVTS